MSKARNAEEITNVVFVLTDDQGPWAARCYGNPEIRTPNMDRLAGAGTLFENFFCASPVCSPSRASFLTGRIPSQHGVHDWISGGNMAPDAADYIGGEVAYTDVLAEHGYTCALSGKWHMGDSLRPQHSFSRWYAHQYGGGDYNKAPMIRDGKPITEKGYITDVITDEGLKMLDTLPEPFCLYVGYTAPHSPWTGHPEEIVASYDDCPFESCPQEPRHPWAISFSDNCLGNREMLKGYFAAVTAMDANLGRIIDSLEAKGLRERTLIVFASDNGFSCGHHGFWGKGNGTSPLNMYENSVRVPFIVSQPGRIPESRRVDALTSAYDFMPTLLDYLGMPIPSDRNLPGRSFCRTLLGEEDRERETLVIYDEYGPARMIRTREWKYVRRYPDGPNELYDLVSDPGERANLVDDPQRRNIVRELGGLLEEWFAHFVEPNVDGRNAEVTGRGQLAPMSARRRR